MKRLSRIFLTGLLALVPLVLTLGLLLWMGQFLETMLGTGLKAVFPEDWYIPGLGLVLAVLLVFGVGAMLQSRPIERWFGRGESLVQRIPLIKSVYGPIREMMDLFRQSDREIGKPVLVRLPWNDNVMMGFLTQDRVGDELGGEGVCAVYLPMSYQIGGFMVLVSKDSLEPLPMNAQNALRFIFTSGMGRSSSSIIQPANDTKRD